MATSKDILEKLRAASDAIIEATGFEGHQVCDGMVEPDGMTVPNSQRDLTQAEMNQVARDCCPVCMGGRFYAGPSAGESTNILCSSCGTEIWWSPPFTAYIMKRDESRGWAYGVPEFPKWGFVRMPAVSDE